MRIGVLVITAYQTYLCSGHGIWFHGEQLDGITHLLQCSLEQLPQGDLATATGAHSDHSHLLMELLTKLYGFMDLNVAKSNITIM